MCQRVAVVCLAALFLTPASCEQRVYPPSLSRESCDLIYLANKEYKLGDGDKACGCFGKFLDRALFEENTKDAMQFLLDNRRLFYFDVADKKILPRYAELI